MRFAMVGLAALMAAGCASSGADDVFGRRGDVVVVRDDDDRVRDRDRNRDRDGDGDRRRPRGLSGVPKGHYPPPGECRLWFPGRPPGHQPPPARCSSLVGRIPRGAFVLYNSKGYDMDYDWRREERRRRGSVPGVILDLARGRN